MPAIRRRALLAAAAAAVPAHRVLPASGQESTPPGEMMVMPKNGIEIEWGFQLGNHVLISLKIPDNLHESRAPFYSQVIYFFPNQTANDAIAGYRQKGHFDYLYAEFNGKDKFITQYSASITLSDGSRYRLTGAPAYGDKSQITIQCNVDSASSIRLDLDTRPLTDLEKGDLQNRLNTGMTALRNLPSMYDKPFGYKLADGNTFLAAFDLSDGKWGRHRAYMGSAPDAKGVPTQWKELQNLQFRDITNKRPGFICNEGRLQMGLGLRTEWNGSSVERALTDNEAAEMAKKLRESPVGEALRPKDYPNPCNNGYNA